MPPGKSPKPVPVNPIPKTLAEGPVTAWEDYFQKNKPSPRAVANTVLQLLTAKKHDHIVALLEAALLNGQAQPWMYETLAVSMEAIGRPTDEIERVLLSSVDFAAVDIPSLLYSATYLAQFGRDERALTLCQQAAKIDPTRPEPYVLGLKLARRLKDADGIRWAAIGSLTRVWIAKYDVVHREADKALVDLEDTLRKSGKTAAADDLAAAIAEARQYDLAIELSWSGSADLELLVEEPIGTICKFDRPRTAGGGVFVHDGYGPDPKNAYEKYLCPRGMSGDYRLIVRHLWGDVVGKRAQLKITRYQGTSRETTETMFVPIGEQDKRFRAPLNHGRLKEPLPTPVFQDLLASARRPERPNMHLLAMERPARERAEALLERARRFGQAAAGYQPVISVISEGVQSQALAVVSADRRYVRLTLGPVFSSLTDVQTFSFLSGGGTNTGGTTNPGTGR